MKSALAHFHTSGVMRGRSLRPKIADVLESPELQTTKDGAHTSESRKLPSLRKLIYIALGALALLWVVPEIIAGLGSIDIQGVERPYLLTFLFVWWDAVIPVFPSESILNTGATLIASGDLDLNVLLLILVGGLGEAIGDSYLYWLSRTVGRK